MEKITGEKLKEARIKKGLTLQQVADEVGCSASYVHRIESSERKSFNYQIYQKLIEILDIPEFDVSSDQNTINELYQLLEISKDARTSLQFALETISRSVNKITVDLMEIENHIEGKITNSTK